MFPICIRSPMRNVPMSEVSTRFPQEEATRAQATVKTRTRSLAGELRSECILVFYAVHPDQVENSPNRSLLVCFVPVRIPGRAVGTSGNRAAYRRCDECQWRR